MTSNRLQGLIRDIFPFPLLPLSLLVGIFYLNFVCRVAIAPLLPVIKTDLGLGLTKAGSLFLLIAAGYSIGLFMSGFVTARLSHRRTIFLSAGVMGLAMVAMSQTVSITGMYLALILAGLSSGFYLPSGIAIITDLVSREHWGRAMAFHELAPNLGFVTAPLLAEALLRLFSWRGVLAFMGVWSILMGLIFLSMGRGGADVGEPPRLRAMRTIITRPSFWMMTAFFMVSIGASVGTYSLMPLFLVSERAMSREWANTLISLSRAAGFVTLFFSGWVTDRIGYKKAMALFLATTGVLILFLGVIPHPGVTALLVVLQASSSVCAFPTGFTMLSAIFPPSIRNLGVSLVFMISYLLGGGAFSLGIAYIAEVSSFSRSFSLLGLVTLSIIPVLLLIRSGESDNA